MKHVVHIALWVFSSKTCFCAVSSQTKILNLTWISWKKGKISTVWKQLEKKRRKQDKLRLKTKWNGSQTLIWCKNCEFFWLLKKEVKNIDLHFNIYSGVKNTQLWKELEKSRAKKIAFEKQTFLWFYKSFITDFLPCQFSKSFLWLNDNGVFFDPIESRINLRLYSFFLFLWWSDWSTSSTYCK